MNFGILGSSFLLPGNQSWNKFNYKKTFCDIGDYKILRSRKFDFIILVLFINDFKNEQNKTNYNNFLPIIKLIEERSKEKNLGTLVMLSSFKKDNLIRVNNNHSNEEKIKGKLINKFLKIKKKNTNFNFTDLDEIFKFRGFENAFDSRNKYLTSCNLSQSGLDELAEFIQIFFERYFQPKYKLLILDCDNTLWGGVLGEDGTHNIEIGETQVGKIYLDFQKEILNLYEQGVLLAIASKNNQKDVFDVLENHPSIILKKKHFVNFKINWKSKAQNINEISKELGLGLDSFVFWDDNPVERNLVRKILPDVYTVEPNKNIVYWPEELALLKNFSSLSQKNNFENKTSKYHARAKFIDDKKSAKDELNYLKSIKLRTKISYLNKNNINRASEMTLKTNQYNLRTKRYSLPEMEKIMLDKNYFTFLIELKDIYADHGKVGLIILKKLNNTNLFLDTFLMSCRVIGRYFETSMFNYIKKFAIKNNFENIVGEFINTQKNVVAKNLLKDHGFKKSKNDKPGKLYICKTNNISIKFDKLYD